MDQNPHQIFEVLCQVGKQYTDVEVASYIHESTFFSLYLLFSLYLNSPSKSCHLISNIFVDELIS